MTWRVGEHYGIHVYEHNRPVATFHHKADALRAVQAVNRSIPARTYSDDEYADALEGKKPERPSIRVLIGGVDVAPAMLRKINAVQAKEHRNHVHHAVYAPGGYIGGAGTEGG